MAKNPKASPDPAALAFSAVEDALKDSVFNLDERSQELPPLDLPDDEEEERRRAGEKLAAHTASVANDDRRGAGRGPNAPIARASALPILIAAAVLLMTGTILLVLVAERIRTIR
jgi:hypothetical protein